MDTYPSFEPDTPLTPEEVENIASKMQDSPDIMMRFEFEASERRLEQKIARQAINDMIDLDLIELYATLPPTLEFIRSLPNTYPRFEEDPGNKTDPDY